MRGVRSVVGVVLILAMLPPSGAAGQSPGTPGGPPASPVPSATAIAEADQGDDCLAWTRYDASDLLGEDAVPAGVATLPDGTAVIVGWQEGSASTFRPTAWVSTDLSTWDAVMLPGGGDYSSAADIAAVDGTVYAVGTRQRPGRKATGLIWSSSDGRTWSGPESVPAAILARVTPVDSGVEVAGISQPRPGEPTTPAIWARTADADWAASMFGGPGYLDGPFVSSSDGTRLRLASEPGLTDWGSALLHLWRSTDGAAWSEVSLPDDLRSTAFYSVASGPHPDGSGFLLATAAIDGGQGGIWRSIDGQEWSQVAESPLVVSALADGPCGPLAFTSPRVNAKGRFARADALVLSSHDGATWTTTSVDAFERAAVRDLAMMTDGGAIAVGEQELVWIGEPDRPAPEPSSGPTATGEPATDATASG